MGTLHWGGGGVPTKPGSYMYVYVSIYIHYVYCSIIIFIIFTVFFWANDVTTLARRCRVQHMLKEMSSGKPTLLEWLQKMVVGEL